jgi:hypothetical protein
MTGPAIHVLARRFRRRQVLAGLAVTAAAGVTAACTDDKIVTVPRRPGDVRPNPVEQFQLYLAAERRLRDAYAATIAKHPALRPKLAPVLAEHVEHVTAMEEITGVAPAPAPSGSPASAPAPPDPAAKAAVPATPRVALAALRAAEKAAAARYAAACLTETGNRAALLASVSACETTHLVVL